MTNAIVQIEARLKRTPDNTVWTASAAPYALWVRYLEVFDAVSILARVEDVPVPDPSWLRVDGERVKVIGLPHYVGPMQFLRCLPAVVSTIEAVTAADAAFLVRAPSIIGAWMSSRLARLGRPYAVEAVGDPYDVFAPGSLRHPLRPLFRWVFTRQMRRQCAKASAVVYVTQDRLQQRYPAGPKALTLGCSDVELGSDAFAQRPRNFDHPLGQIRLVTVASLAQLYKAPDILIRATALLLQRGLVIHLTIVGDGAFRGHLEQLATVLGVNDHVTFVGELRGAPAVREAIRSSDIFVLPSRTEGLPRALLEAMAQGLPCIGSRVGGIPELLDPGDLVPPGDCEALASAIQGAAESPQRLTAMANRNFQIAQRFKVETLSGLRAAFYRGVRRQAEDSRNGEGVQ